MVMSAVDTVFLSATDALALIKKRDISPVELTLAQLERIERLQPSLRAYITVTEEIALAEARAAESAVLRGDERPLLGLPVAYKDIIMTAGVRTTGASKVHEHFVPAMSATVVEKLHAAGVVMLGKLVTHEFASGLTPEDYPFPPARNPWDPGRIPGGSSSGSGAALAAGIAYGALGTDTGGSIRGPASFCGIAGLKPTYGRTSRYGVFMLSWSLDHIGPMGRTVADCALMLAPMSGYDPLDPGSAKQPVSDYTAALGSSIRGLKIGVLRSWYAPTAAEEVQAAVDGALAVFTSLGAVVKDVELPSIDLAKAVSAVMLPEAYSYHAADLNETPQNYGPQLVNRLKAGGLFFAHEYVTAQRARSILREDIKALLSNVDILVSPTSPKPAPTFDEAYGEAMRRGASYTSLYNMTGLPALSIPCGFTDAGLPIGLQLAGRPFDEATVLQAGHAYEQSAGWFQRHPQL